MDNCFAEFRSMLDGLEEERLFSMNHKYSKEEMWEDLSI
jgi:hypothetical protein